MRDRKRGKFDLTVILPVFNEAKILSNSVNIVRGILNKKYKYEIIIAEDGSTDGTDKITRMLTKKYKNVVWIHSDKRLGRGKAVANAIKKSRGKIVGFIDVDLEISPKYIPSLVKEIEMGADIATGRRYYQPDIKHFLSWTTRAIASKMYVFLVRLLLGVNIKDTETGCKFFKKNKILPILDEVEDNHWFWDTEIIARSYYKKLKIKEVPVIFEKKWERTSKVNIVNDSIYFFIKLLKFKLKKRI
ncbi:MAG: glycosyltransferase [Methanosarcinales archaeon]